MKKIFFKKSLFIDISAWPRGQEQRLVTLFNSARFQCFKWKVFALWFYTRFLKNDSLLFLFPFVLKFFFFFPFKKTSLTIIKKNINVLNFRFNLGSKGLIFHTLYLYNLFFFNRIITSITHFLIPKYFWFNLRFLVKNQDFLKNFLFLFTFVSNEISINYFTINTFLNWLITNVSSAKKHFTFEFFIKNFFTKIFFLLENGDLFLFNLEILWNLKTKFLFNFLNLVLYNDTKKLLNKYVAYQAFLNTSLYLTWNFLFLKNISTSSLNVLLLRNFNKVFYWIGDKYKSHFFLEKTFWAWQSVFFRKGSPYLSYYTGKDWENFLLLPSNFIFQADNISYFSYLNFFVSNNLISYTTNFSRNSVFFNNSYIYY